MCMHNFYPLNVFKTLFKSNKYNKCKNNESITCLNKKVFICFNKLCLIRLTIQPLLITCICIACDSVIYTLQPIDHPHGLGSMESETQTGQQITNYRKQHIVRIDKSKFKARFSTAR